MSAALIAALFFTVALLVTTAYFILGSVPLLILKHDTPKDSRFVRGFFNLYYRAAMFAASGATVSYAIAERPVLAAGALALMLLAAVLRRTVISKMEALGVQIQDGAIDAVLEFRRTHLTAILINLVQLVLIVWALTAFSPR